ncbi:hypothetical protein [Roseospira navarrensis]|uniref:EAL domain-containing protein n=1 Tax=Roseospira navarrensis TaxID=140058 RepID=A0A7X2D211_9PROT|nr:hypothetical protein [Roseospira navarrensis]MQX35196.1 hypothetical protein [Roseospira navarrensis]
MGSGNTLVHGDQSLLNGLDRVERAPEGCRAVFLALSRLRPVHRDPIRLRLAAHLFEPLVTGQGCQVFLLSDGDLVVLGRDVPMSMLEAHAERVRALFRADPASRLVDDVAPTDERLFIVHYDLETGASLLRRRVEAKVAASTASERVLTRTQPPPADTAPTPRPLLNLTRALETLDIRQLVRRQPMVHIDSERLGRVFCEEFYVSVAEVRRQCAPTMDVKRNRWLFQEVCRQLDPRIISNIRGLPRLTEGDIALGLNLTLETLVGPQLDPLLKGVPPGTRIIAEIGVTDTFTNLDLVPAAAKRLRAAGHALALDAVDPRALAMINPARLPIDHLKLLWTDDLIDPAARWDGPHPEVVIRSLGPERLVLSRVDTERAVMWGLKHGIRIFQGFFIDQVFGATTMAACAKRGLCTLTQCVERRRAACGGSRTTCPNPKQLTAVTHLRALSGPASGGPRRV